MAEQIPVGTIMLYAGSDSSSSILNLFQDGWLLCDGGKYKRTSLFYSALFSVIGESFGGDDNDFCVPMLRGLFLRGVTGDTPTDPEAANRMPPRPDLPNVGNKGPDVGSLQDHALQSHSHSYSVYSAKRNQDHIAAQSTINNQAANTSITSGEGVHETRPTNIYANFIIKFLAQDTSIPTGAIIPYAGALPADSLAGTGWLACDGSSLTNVQYSDLHEVIESYYGATADGASFFLPDYRGLFVRGVQGTPPSGVTVYDPDATSRTAPRPDLPAGSQGNTGDAVGSIQGYEMRAHSHSYAMHKGSHTCNYGSLVGPGVFTGGTSSQTSVAQGGKEIRPVNLYVNYVIRYK